MLLQELLILFFNQLYTVIHLLFYHLHVNFLLRIAISIRCEYIINFFLINKKGLEFAFTCIYNNYYYRFYI